MFRSASRFAFIGGFFLLLTLPALAIDGEVLITQAKANAGNVTPGDDAGFPVTITRPGSYKLAGNLSIPLNKSGIQVTANDVTIDLDGFRIHGDGKAYFGIQGGGWASLTVRNGTIALFREDGIRGTGPYWIIENMRLTHNLKGGARLGPMSRVTASTITSNLTEGVSCATCHVEGNIVSKNGTGIYVYGFATILGNTIHNNSSYGIFAAETTGYGNNTLIANNQTGSQTFGITLPMQPNVCAPSCN